MHQLIQFYILKLFSFFFFFLIWVLQWSLKLKYHFLKVVDMYWYHSICEIDIERQALIVIDLSVLDPFLQIGLYCLISLFFYFVFGDAESWEKIMVISSRHLGEANTILVWECSLYRPCLNIGFHLVPSCFNISIAKEEIISASSY